MILHSEANARSALVDAEILLRDWPRRFECKAVRLTGGRALVATRFVKDLPDWFCLSLAPHFEPQPCTVIWRGRDTLKVMMFE
ncbi:hypothetical protein AEGHOMDF_4053 [Methylobacterium soli]|nr:hypothetical protein AEGHOMDF_4053 [Methylobacterium soli]